MTRADDEFRGHSPEALHRADGEAMVATLAAQLFARHHHGEPGQAQH